MPKNSTTLDVDQRTVLVDQRTVLYAPEDWDDYQIGLMRLEETINALPMVQPNGIVLICLTESVCDGEMVAVCKDEQSYFGYLMQYAGVVGLVQPNDEPLVFMKDEIEVVGRVIGYTDHETDEEGSFLVKAIA